jgi:hypothetical protein
MGEKKTTPNFIGVGAMKCATTWISECLRYHPEVFMSSPKEIHYFSNHYKKGLDWYLHYFEDATEYKSRGEISVDYLPNSAVPNRIMEKIGGVKLLVSLRNPVERFISHYKHYVRSGYVENELNLKNYQKAVSEYPELLQRGNYSEQLINYIDIFGLDKIKIILKENIDSQPKKVVSDIYEFLDVDKDYVPPIIEKKVSPGITPKIKFLESMRIKIHILSKKYAPWFINFVKKYRITEFYRKINSKKEFTVTPEVEKILSEYYENEIIATEELINKDLSIWK